METFREEHYEVEQMWHGSWCKEDYECVFEDEAQKYILDNSGRGRKFRIIRCTTIREVVE